MCKKQLVLRININSKYKQDDFRHITKRLRYHVQVEKTMKYPAFCLPEWFVSKFITLIISITKDAELVITVGSG